MSTRSVIQCCRCRYAITLVNEPPSPRPWGLKSKFTIDGNGRIIVRGHLDHIQWTSQTPISNSRKPIRNIWRCCGETRRGPKRSPRCRQVQRSARTRKPQSRAQSAQREARTVSKCVCILLWCHTGAANNLRVPQPIAAVAASPPPPPAQK